MTTRPNWLVVLQREVDATSQHRAARRLGLHQTIISRILNGKDISNHLYSRVAMYVKQVLIDGNPLDKSQPVVVEPALIPLPPGTTRRLCLKCRRPFASNGIGNRLCGPCRSSNRAEGEHGGIF